MQPCGSQDCIISNTSTTCGESVVVNSANLQLQNPMADTIKLSGSVIVTQSTTITDVSTYIKVCDRDILPSACPNAETDCLFSALTAATIPSPPSVIAGQQVMVTVDISFM